MEIPKHTKQIIFDIETNGLLLNVTKMWVGVTYCIEEKLKRVFYDPKELTKYLIEDTEALLIGHNIRGYDIPALEKLTGIPIKNQVIDTLTLAKLVFYDKSKDWSHSLDAYGQRLKFPKGHHSDWTKYSTEMETYCVQDVRVTKRLYELLLKESEWLPWEALNVEQEVQRIITKQYMNGWTFDIKNAKKLHIELVKEKEEAEKELFKVFKPMLIPKGKIKVPSKPFTRLKVTTVGAHQPIELTEFNPGSGNHIVLWIDRLFGEQDWRPTEKGAPKTDAETLIDMFSDYEWASPLLHYMEVNKLLGQLAEGDKAWLKLVNYDTSKIHHSVDILGTNTGRATHTNPNLAQVPAANKAYMGAECRALFTVPKDKVLVGCDLSGVELRCLAHYMGKYDNGEYAKIILEGDIHTANQQAAGLDTRSQAKTMVYCYLYGGGDAKLGAVVNGAKKEGKKIRDKLESNLPALGILIKKVKQSSKKGYLVGITGRRLKIRSEHSALNVLLQSLGAYISKYWMIKAHQLFEEENINLKQLLWCHDELQVECDKKDEERVKVILQVSATIASEEIGIRMRIDAESKSGKTWYDCH